jgi:hypothetical protein
MRKSAMGPKVVDKMAGQGGLEPTINNVDNDWGCKSTSKYM